MASAARHRRNEDDGIVGRELAGPVAELAIDGHFQLIPRQGKSMTGGELAIQVGWGGGRGVERLLGTARLLAHQRVVMNLEVHGTWLAESGGCLGIFLWSVYVVSR